MHNPLRIGTRDSALAIWQANTLQSLLEKIGIKSVLIPIKSEGDLNLTQPLYAMGTTGIFTKTLDVALLNNQIDIAIHSMKDVPTLLPKGIVQAAVLKRGETEDVMIWKNHNSQSKETKIIATGSLRRKAQWLSEHPKDKVVPLRGNIQTRLEKLHKSDWDGAIFAAAALKRLELIEEHVVPLIDMLPAAAQGALMIVCRSEDNVLKQKINTINHSDSALCTQIERDFLRTLEGGCTAPIGALATVKDGMIYFKGGLYSLIGSQKEEIDVVFPLSQVDGKGASLATSLLNQGGGKLMKEYKQNS